MRAYTVHSDVQPNRMVGAVLGGAYRITALLAEGGMGWVYEARHLRLNKRVAVKLMARELAANPEALARFHREAEVTSQLGHPHLVNVLDFGTTDDGNPYLVMEYLDGEDLERRIHRDKRLPLQAAVAIVRQVASALGAAHAEGIVHRDLKPANVFLVKVPDEADFVKVLDFGISKIKAGRTKLTRATAVLGTPEYMSPEQANGLIEDIDHRVDQWALACIAWEMLSGYSPFIADDIGAVFYRIINTEPHPLSARAPELPPTIEPVLRRALSKQAADRYPSIKEFSRAFESAAMGKPVEATPPPILMSVPHTRTAPTHAATAGTAARPDDRRVTLGYGDPPEVRAGSSQLGMTREAGVSEAGSGSHASTFEVRVLSSTEPDAFENAFEDGLSTRRYKPMAIVAIAAGVILAAAVIALRPRKIVTTATPAHEVHSLPAVHTLPTSPTQAPTQAAAPSPEPIVHVQERAAEEVAAFGTHPDEKQPLARTGVPGRGDHKKTPESIKNRGAVERPSVVDPFQSDPAEPFVRPAEPERSDPFQPDKVATKKAAARTPEYADPFESEAAAAKTPVPGKQPSYADPFEPDRVGAKPRRQVARPPATP
jgi:serine/threonine protein kinase